MDGVTLFTKDEYDYYYSHSSSRSYSSSYTKKGIRMTTQRYIEKIVVTFFEGAIGYLVVLPNPSYTKATLIGALAAGLSFVYNVVRESIPTTATPPLVVTPLNGVAEIAATPAEVPPTVITPTV